MSGRLPGLDLLRERRLELGLPAEPPRPPEPRRLLLIGSAIGVAIVLASVAAAALLKLQGRLLEQELARLAPGRDQVERLEAELSAGQATLERNSKGNAELVSALVAVRSGSALLSDLAGRTPAGLQLVSLQVGQDDLQLKGQSADPGAFERINALVLSLKASPLLDPAAVTLNRAIRQKNASGKGPESRLVEFELTAAFRAPAASSAQLKLLQELGAAGMARRLELLQQEGLLR
ncbi:PilN domain-containing protein [Synechococcus sp. CS-1329]|jgi:type IV pilus assembly protein PilN|uniref:PilN domain-containing protein n=1 Tax=Synechococcus sp. CS-1329 TaxID=2847975 RepID=UPI00223B2B56|nr:PilN domain-containing protein [Synechococcus sp. CS-1329]MCT0218971.1 PilN domain-containing protein [Synechococcus sp. CS-1329]